VGQFSTKKFKGLKMLKHYIEELNLIFMERLEYIESVEDYLILKEQIEELNNCYKDLYKLLDKKLLEIF
jgi:hypothetical protein